MMMVRRRKLVLCVCLMFVLCKYNGVTSILIMEDTQKRIESCMSHIYAHAYEHRTFVVTNLTSKSNLTLKPKSPNYNSTIEFFSQTNFESVKHLWQFQMFVISIENISNFENIFELLSKIVAWDTRAKFLVGYLGSEDIGDIFRISWRYYVTNINVVAMKEDSTNIYTYFPYSNKNKGEYKDYEILSDCTDMDLDQIFPQKVPLDLNGLQIRIMPYVLPPYVINYNITEDDPGRAGIEVTIFRNVAKRMNLRVSIINHKYSHWGYRYPDGNYSLMYKDLIDCKTDVIFGFMYGNASYSKELDGSFSHLSDSSNWYFPMAIQMPQWKNLMNIFEPVLWLAIFSMMLITALAWWIIGRLSETSTHYHDIIICIMSSLYVLLQGSVDSPHTWKVRFIFVPWLLSCVLIFTAHQCQLTSILTSPIYESQMTTLKELVDSGMEFGFYPTITEAYKDNNSVAKQILDRFQPCPLSPECLNKTAFTRNYAVIKNRRQVMYLMPRFYTYPNGRVMLYDTNIAAFNTRERYYMRKGYPLLDRIDSILILLCSNGLIAKWDRDLRFFKFKGVVESHLEPLSINHLQGAFMIYTFGVSFAGFILICEKICDMFCARKYKIKIKHKIWNTRF